MKIKRTVNGQEIEFELTSAELVEAHDEFVTNFMKNVFIEDFGIENEDDAQELANMAYDLYCKGTGLTEYECCEQVFDEYGEDEWDDDEEDSDSFLDDLHREQTEQM